MEGATVAMTALSRASAPRFRIEELKAALASPKLGAAGAAALFADLRGLRNQAAHERDLDLSAESAVEYLNLCAALRGWLDGKAESFEPTAAPVVRQTP